MTDRHKTQPKAVRMPPGLLPRVEAAAEADGASVNGFIVAAIEEKLDRRGSGTTARTRKPRADSAPPATFRPPKNGQPAACPHPKARINKGLCGACGTHVGTSGAR